MADTAIAQGDPSLDASSELRVYLFASDMSPLAGNRVVATSQAGRRVEISVESDAEGCAQLKVQPGTWRVKLPVSEVSEASEGSEASPAPLVSSEVTITVRTQNTVEIIAYYGERRQLLHVDTEEAVKRNESSPLKMTQGARRGAHVTIRGVVTLRGSKTPIAGARILIKGSRESAVSDQRGRYTLRSPVGELRLIALHPKFRSTTTNIKTSSSQKTVTLNLTLESAHAELEESVVILPKLDQTSVLSQLEQRRRSSSVSDSISLADMKNSADSDASSATRRIVGATIVGGAFLNVRGLSGRYTSVKLNGTPLPSTDPDLPGFQIDLFPVSLLTSLTVDKTFRPEIPGDFAGGSMNVQTRDYSEEPELRLSLSLSSDSLTLGQRGYFATAGASDLTAWGAGSRRLPSSFPSQRVSGGFGGLSREERSGAARSLPVSWTGKEATALPNLSLSGSYSGTTRSLPFGEQLGYILTVGYRLKNRIAPSTVANVNLQGSEGAQTVVLRERLNRDIYSQSAGLGVLNALSLKLTDWDELRLVSLLTQAADNDLSATSGVSENEGLPIEQTQQRYVSRRLIFEQLIGRHEDIIQEVNLRWSLDYANVERAQPDTRNVLYVEGSEGFIYRNATGSGERLFSDLGQSSFGGAIDVDSPLEVMSSLGRWEIKTGAFYRNAERTFSARRFGTQVIGGDQSDRLLPPDQFFAHDQYGALIDFVELTRASDGYINQSQVAAGYLSLEGQLNRQWRLMGGARYERFTQQISVSSPFSGNDEEARSEERIDADLLPAIALMYMPTSTLGVRLSYGGTVARPLVRELAPFLQQDFVRRRAITGNPELKRTLISNADLRVEWFPSETEVFAISGFYKHFNQPIESVIKDRNGNLSFENIPTAVNMGLELELRLKLKRFSALLNHFELIGNMALIRSEVRLSDDQALIATNQERALQGQSPYVANAVLSYQRDPLSLSLLYNVFGRRIGDVGVLGLPDVFEEEVHSLDFTGSYQLSDHYSISASVKNLLLQPLRFTQGGFDFKRVNRGLGFGVRLGLSY